MEHSQAATHYIQLTEILKKHSSYSNPSLVSHKKLCNEWVVIQSQYDPDAGLKCLCGKENIHHHHVIKNHINGAILDPIGSSCIKRFEIEQLGITCMCCEKPLSENNLFLQAYMHYSPITKETQIIGHKPCANKLLKNAKKSGRYGSYLKKDFVAYFNHLGITVKLDRSVAAVRGVAFHIEYDNLKLNKYVDIIFD